MVLTKGLVIPTRSPGVRLRQFEPKDALAYHKLIEQNRVHLSQHGDQTSAKYPDYQSVWWSMVDSEKVKLRMGIWLGKRLAGTVNLLFLDEGVTEIGYWVGKDFCRQGLATLAVETLTAWAHSAPRHYAVRAHVREDNKASLGVLKKTGFEVRGKTGNTFELYHILK